ncbi:MAG: DUF3299 domain-containing protein [Bacteroidota bacterium]
MKQTFLKHWLRGSALGIFCLSFFSLSAQQMIDWPQLAKVTFSYVQNFDQNFWYGKPKFHPEILALEGKEVVIKGYILPMDISGESYALSANPFSTCFFCGGAGQESVMELRLKKKKARFETDQVVTFVGTFRLNDEELELNYILEEARVYEP